MTQKEKAEAYDEALERARKLYNSEETSADVEIACETIFPELAESEDELIRKEIIAFLKENLETGRAEETWSLSGLERWIAWLEMQGQEKHLSEPIKDYQGNFTCWNNAHDFRPKHLQRCICYDKYMGGVYCYVYDDISKYWCTQTTEEHDSDGDNHICDYADFRITLWMPLPDTSFYPSKSRFDKQGYKPQGKTALEAAKEEKVDNVNKVEPKFKVKYAGNEYNVFETKDIAGVTFYGIEDEPNHIDYVKAENCEIISVYAIKENGSPYPTKPAVFSEKKPKRMISAEAKECIYGSDNEQVSSEKIGKDDTLLDLLQKMPSCITVDGIDYHFVMKKTSIYLAYYACYKDNGEEGRGNAILGITAHSPIDLLTEMLEILKEKGLLK